MTNHNPLLLDPTPTEIIQQAQRLMPQDESYLTQPVLERFGNPQQPIYVDQSNVDINGVIYESPMILPIYNGQLELIQCAVLQDKQSIAVIADGLAQGFSYYGALHQDKPVLITYSLDAYFKIAQTGCAVVLVILPHLCYVNKSELKAFDFEQIQFVIHQLSKAGYTQLYIPVRPEHIQLEAFKKLEKNTSVKLLNQLVKFENNEHFIDLVKDDDIEDVQAFIAESIALLSAIECDETDRMESEVLRLANLTELQYEQIRASEAELLSIRASILDKLVKAKRKELADEKSKESFFENVEAWNHPVNGHELLNSIEQVIDAHIACETHTRTATALWIVYTWAIDAMQIAPIACITAPEKRCGKTQLLTLISELCYKPLPTSNITAAALYRAIEEWKPTLLIDEADTFLKDNEDLRGVINAGHSRKNAYVIRCDGDDNKPTRFNVWCAKAISGIGHLPETIKDRSIILELRRKLPSEHKQRLRHADHHHWNNIKRKCLRWVNDHFDEIQNTRPDLPEQLNDRAQDNWESLFVIAQIASKEWLDKAIHSALTINGVEVDTLSINEQLLVDIKAIFDKTGGEKIFSNGLVNALIEDDENVWATWNRGQPITKIQLTTRLKQFGVKSKDVRIGTEVKKGFDLNQFKDAFKRYLPLPPIQNATSLQPICSKDYSPKQNATQHESVASKKPLKPIHSNTCSVVASQNPLVERNTQEEEETPLKKQVKVKQSSPEKVVDTQTIDMFEGGL